MKKPVKIVQFQVVPKSDHEEATTLWVLDDEGRLWFQEEGQKDWGDMGAPELYYDEDESA